MATFKFQQDFYGDGTSAPSVSLELLKKVSENYSKKVSKYSPGDEDETEEIESSCKHHVSPVLIQEKLAKVANGETEAELLDIFAKFGISSTQLGQITAQHILELGQIDPRPDTIWAVSLVSFSGPDSDRYCELDDEFLTLATSEKQALFIAKLLEATKGCNSGSEAMTITVQPFNTETLEGGTAVNTFTQETSSDYPFYGDKHGNQHPEYAGQPTCRDAAIEYFTLFGQLVADRLPVSPEVFAAEEVANICAEPDEIYPYYLSMGPDITSFALKLFK